jgi:hypothetical protein
MNANTSAIQVHSTLLQHHMPASGIRVNTEYGDIVRVCTLLAFYEGGLSSENVASYANAWAGLGELLNAQDGWLFTIRGLEPMWILDSTSGYLALSTSRYMLND